MQDLIRSLLADLGEDPAREGLRETPRRVEESLKFLTQGYRADVDAVINDALFSVDYNEMVIVKDIDKGMKLGCGYPMGPFTLLDFVGLDTTYYIANIMFEEYREPAYAPPPLLKRMVLAGRLGKKSGQGFYKY